MSWFTVFIILSRPHLMLAYICSHNSIIVCQRINSLNNIRTCQTFMIIFHRHSFFSSHYFLNPVFVILLFQFFIQYFKNRFQITNNRIIYLNIFIYLSRINVNMDNFCIISKFFGITCNSVRKSCSQHDQKITLCYTEVGCLCSVHSKHTCVIIICAVKCSFSHKGIRYRCIHFFHEIFQLSCRTGNNCTAAYKDHRFF
ncbi:unknown [Clostridium sp. CAG:167]|nr:unknown [Clostridium sp. CAG:167]